MHAAHSDQSIVMVATVQEMVRENSGNFTSSQGKFKSLKKVRGRVTA